MKIVIATAVYYPMINGVAVFSHNLALGLAERGHEVVVICPSQTGQNYTIQEGKITVHYLKSVEVKVYPDQIHQVPARRRVLGIRLPRLFYRHGFRVSVFPAKEVRQIMQDFRPDVVHVQVSDPIGLSVVAYAKKYGIPVVTTEHNQPEVLTEPLHVPKIIKKPAQSALRAYFVNRQSKSDFVTMPTKKAISDLIWSRKRYFDVPVAAVSNGVDLSKFSAGEPAREVYAKYGVPKDAEVILYVGRVDPEKRVDVVIEAFAKMIKNDSNKLDSKSNICLVIAGDGVDKARLVRLTEKLGISEKVVFLGRVVPPDLYDVYKMGTIFVTASEIETQGIVLIEAAASGLPLIAVDKGAVSEVCVDQENGFLCQPGNVSEIAAAMWRLMSDTKLRKKFAAKSLEIAKEHDFETTLDKFENIYRKVIRNNTKVAEK